MIKELLVALDGSPESLRGLDAAAALGRRSRTPVSAVIVSSPGIDTLADRVWLQDHAAALGLELERIILAPSNDVVDTLLSLAAGSPGVVLCMSSHGRSGFGRAVLGSVSEAVVRRSPSPVLLVGPHAAAPDTFNAVEICLDGSPLAERALMPAVAWATALNATPWLVNVEDPGAPAVLGDTTLGVEVRAPAERLRHDGIAAEWEILHGDPSLAIVREAANIGGALIVAASHGRSGLADVLLGSVAAGIVRNATCPVLLVGPSVIGQPMAAA